MELEKENKRLKVLIIILLLILIGLGGYYCYTSFIKNNNILVDNNCVDKNITSPNNITETSDNVNGSVEQKENENNSEQNDNSENKETYTEKYNYDDFVERVYVANNNGSYYLNLYSNKTISYTLTDIDGNIVVKYFGSFTINKDTIIFNVLSGYNKNKEYVIPKDDITIEFKIEEEHVLIDLTNNVKLNRANQPVRAGGSPLSSFEDNFD